MRLRRNRDGNITFKNRITDNSNPKPMPPISIIVSPPNPKFFLIGSGGEVESHHHEIDSSVNICQC